MRIALWVSFALVSLWTYSAQAADGMVVCSPNDKIAADESDAVVWVDQSDLPEMEAILQSYFSSVEVNGAPNSDLAKALQVTGHMVAFFDTDVSESSSGINIGMHGKDLGVANTAKSCVLATHVAVCDGYTLCPREASQTVSEAASAGEADTSEAAQTTAMEGVLVCSKKPISPKSVSSKTIQVAGFQAAHLAPYLEEYSGRAVYLAKHHIGDLPAALAAFSRPVALFDSNVIEKKENVVAGELATRLGLHEVANYCSLIKEVKLCNKHLPCN